MLSKLAGTANTKARACSPFLLLTVLAVIIVALAAVFVLSPMGSHAGHQSTANQMAPNARQ